MDSKSGASYKSKLQMGSRLTDKPRLSQLWHGTPGLDGVTVITETRKKSSSRLDLRAPCKIENERINND